MEWKSLQAHSMKYLARKAIIFLFVELHFTLRNFKVRRLEIEIKIGLGPKPKPIVRTPVNKFC